MIDLITGHQGMAHITAEQISDINNAMMDGYGVDKVMRLDGGDVTLDGLSLVIEVGYWRVNGFDMEIKEEETLYFDPTVAGVSRIDDVYVEILQDITDGYQRAVLVIVQGEPDVSPVAPDEPTAPELNTDILLQIVHVARCTISSGAMTVSDKTIVYKYVSPEDLTNITIKGSTNNTGSTIASGTYFYLNGVIVKAKTSIANGATLTLNTNYEIPPAGAINDLKSSFNDKMNKVQVVPLNTSTTYSDVSNYFLSNTNSILPYGRFVYNNVTVYVPVVSYSAANQIITFRNDNGYLMQITSSGLTAKAGETAISISNIYLFI